jgi:hypothetical protein
MRFLQILGTLICFLLAIISLQLRGLKPMTTGQMNRLKENQAAYEKAWESLPLVNVYEVQTNVGADVMSPAKVTVENTVSVTTGYTDLNGKFVDDPLDVEIRR